MDRSTAALIAPLVLAAACTLTLAEPPATQRALNWSASLDAGYAKAQASQQAMLVFAADDRSFAAAEPMLAGAKAVADKCVLVRIKPEDREALRAVGVASLPALRLLTPSGRVVARLDKLESAAAVSAWIEKSLPLANDVAQGGGDIKALVGRLGSADADAREAAIRQLQSKQKEASGLVVEALAGTDLTARVSAMDLLEAWKAPIDGIDPWERSSITPERLALLRSWTTDLAKGVPLATTAPTTQESASIAEDLDLLIAAPTAADARAVRERLVRQGDRILPELYQRLRIARSEETRRRLVAARYRVVATDALAAAWPGGFDRIADATSRREAVRELLGRATAADARLLLELFSDADPLVREESLSKLKTLGGAEATGALVKLLGDPEPNVRVAVLKTLGADKADPALAPQIAAYVAQEKDSDLVVHAIHVLKVMPGAAAVDTLRDLLANPEWRVRAEAVEALREKVGRGYGDSNLPADVAARVQVALVKCLEDEEPFVVSQAVIALGKARSAASVKPLLKTLERRPDLAEQILSIFTDDPKMVASMIDQIRPLIRHEKPELRAAAVTVVAAAVPDKAAEEIKLAIADSDARVRAAGVEAIATAIEPLKPADRMRDSFGPGAKSKKKVDIVTAINDFRSGKTRPAWLTEIDSKMAPALAGLRDKSKYDAATVLAALGHDDQAMQMLEGLIVDAGSVWRSRDAMFWLAPPERETLLRKMLSVIPNDSKDNAISAFAQVPSPETERVLWTLLGEKDVSREVVGGVKEGLEAVYCGDNVFDMSEIPAAQRKKALESLRVRAAEGSDIQRALAIRLIARLDKVEGIALAIKAQDEPTASDMLKRCMLQIRLAEAPQPDPQSTALAVSMLDNPVMRKLAVRFLAGGAEAITGDEVPDNLLYNDSVRHHSYEDGPVEIAVPEGLKAESLRPLLKDADTDLAAYAGYLLVLAGDNEGFDPLIKKIDGKELEFSPYLSLAYRAIAKSDDASRLPIIEKIYGIYKAQNDRFNIRTLYWTIRPMKGEAALKLRKKIRDEIGMDNLR